MTAFIPRTIQSLSCLVIVSFLFFSCFKKQGHEAIGPELPNYTVSGRVFHSVTNEPLPGARVIIEDQSALTDSLGQYTISNVPGGASHNVTVTKAYFETFETILLLGYADLDSFDIILGKIIYFSDRFQGPYREPNGLCWTGDNPWSSDGLRKRIYRLNGTLNWVNYLDSPGSFPPKEKYTTPYGLTATQEGETRYLWVSVAFDDGAAYTYKSAVRSDATLSTEARYKTPNSVYGPDVTVLLDDLTYDGAHLWSCSAREHKIYKHQNDMNVIETYDPPDERPSGIAWDGSNFWLTTQRSNRLYLLNGDNLTSTGYYVLQESPVTGLEYRDGFLWACKHGRTGWFYKYRIE
ncbi:MAG: carboxypeptidase regulatory-like domain-containing protein [Gemmatimonadota bacterium]|nr:MAG: carboxypeptidase regulatory-like domain-containing protein [Gemmatimonadota bacterium]